MSLDPSLVKQGKSRFMVKASELSAALREVRIKFRDMLPDYDYIESDDPERFMDLACEQNLFNSRRKVLVLTFFEPDHVEGLSKLFTQNSDDVLIIVYTRALPRNKASTRLKGACHTVSLKKMDKNECLDFVRMYLKKVETTFAADVPSFLVDQIGYDPDKLENEIKKIIYYYSEQKTETVTAQDCGFVISGGTGLDYFKFMDSFFRKRFSEVFSWIGYVSEYEYIKLIAFMRSQVERVYKVAVYKEHKMSPDDISELIGVPKFIINMKMMPVLSFFGKIKLLKLLDMLNSLDEKLRETKFSKKLVLESYLARAMKI